MRKTVVNNGTTLYTQDYINGIEYRNGTLEAIYHSEGRVTTIGGILKYEYAMKDHLGNTRLMFCDRNGDGVIKPENAPEASEVTQENSYYAFGMNMEFGNWENTPSVTDNLKQYNGKELNTDFGLNWNDYGRRMYDPAISRFVVMDRFAEKYQAINPYQYGANNPIKNIDVNGDSVIAIKITDKTGYIHMDNSRNNTLFIDHTAKDKLVKLLNHAAINKTHIFISSAFRTNARQAELQNDKSATTPAAPSQSQHNAGTAIDFVVYKDNIYNESNPETEKPSSDNEVVKYAKGLGFRWGGDFNRSDPVHVDQQLIGENFTSVRDQNQKQMNGDEESSNNIEYVKRIDNVIFGQQTDILKPVYSVRDATRIRENLCIPCK